MDFEVTPDDLELVHALQIAPRATWTELGEVLQRHPTTLSERWSRLRANRVAWTLGHLGGRPEMHCTALIDVEADPLSMQETLQALCAVPEVNSVDSSSRHADFRLTCISADWLVMSRQVLPALWAIKGVLRLKTSVCTKVYASGEQWRLDVLSRNQEAALRRLAPIPQPTPTLPPSALWPCLRVLQADGRATAREIAAATGQHPSTTARFLRQALAAGMIYIRCELASDYSGSPLWVQWFTKVPPGMEDRVAQFLKGFRSLRLCAATTGEANLIFNMQLREPSEIVTIERQLVAQFPQMNVLETCVGTHSYKRMGWLLETDGRCRELLAGSMPVRG
ncbi:Lrp/AsnC family transcriptional regulator [Glutamicibacter creatinolyticus]|uniref:Lrp/AsnC family transcriptional regulator n=1 Tax=Glutamicibacter creatinolyticus TaxID=162496 RepID=UPI0031E15ED2